MSAYQNPVYPHSFPDPFVLKHKGEYWGYCTGFWHDGRAFGILRSRDLVHWQEMPGALEPLPGNHPCYWAPEVAYLDGRFHLYYSVGNEERMEIRVAVSDQPGGPFVDSGRRLTSEPFAIDAHIFEEDGERWLFYATDFLEASHIGTGTVRDRLLDPFTLEGDAKPVALPRYDWHVYHPNRPEKGFVRWHTVEGPFVLKRKGVYYEMFSGGNWQNPTYGVSYATARSLADPGEWTQAELPILRTGGEVVGPGHNSVVRGPDNRQLYCVYHRWSPDLSARVMAIDPLDWAGERMIVLGPTTTLQPGPVPPTISDLLDAPAVLRPGEAIRYETGAPCFLVEVTVEGEGLKVVLHGDKEESFRVGAGLDGGVGARPALSETTVVASQGGSRPLPAVQTRPYPNHPRLLRFEVDGTDVTAISFVADIANIGTVELSGFALTAGWEDLFREESAGRLYPSSWTAKGPAFASWLAVVNARLEGEGWYGLGLDPGPRFVLARRGEGWILGTGEQNLPFPAAFDPTIDQQFRLMKTGDRLEIAWEGTVLGTVPVPPGPARLTIGAAGESASFEAARLTAI